MFSATMVHNKAIAMLMAASFWSAAALAQEPPMLDESGNPAMMASPKVEEKKIEPIYDALQLSGDVTDQSGIVQAIKENAHDKLRIAASAGADVNAVTTDGSYPIILATLYGDAQLMKILTGNGADVNVKDKMGRNAMHYAAMMGRGDRAKLLMLMNIDADEPDMNGITPLYYAYFNNHLPLANFLVTIARAKVNRVDAEGDPLAFQLVSLVDNPVAVEHLIKHRLNLFKRNRKDLSLIEVAKMNKHDQSANLLKAEYDRAMKAFKDQLRNENKGSNPSSSAPVNP